MQWESFAKVMLKKGCNQEFPCSQLAVTGQPEETNDDCLKCKKALEVGLTLVPSGATRKRRNKARKSKKV